MGNEETVVYQEPAPHIDKENALESMMSRFDHAAEILGIRRGVYEYLKTPVKQIIVSIPIQMDNGDIEVFEGYLVVSVPANGQSGHDLYLP